MTAAGGQRESLSLSPPPLRLCSIKAADGEVRMVRRQVTGRRETCDEVSGDEVAVEQSAGDEDDEGCE